MALLFRHPGACREPVISLTNQQRRRNAALLKRRYSWIFRKRLRMLYSLSHSWIPDVTAICRRIETCNREKL